MNDPFGDLVTGEPLAPNQNDLDNAGQVLENAQHERDTEHADAERAHLLREIEAADGFPQL